MALSGYVLSQKIADSLTSRLEKATDYDRAEILNLIATSLVEEYPDEAQGYAEDALAIAQKFQNTEEHINALLNIGDCYYYRDNYDVSSEYFNDALQLSIRNNNPEFTAFSYHSLAINFDYQNDLEMAEEDYIRAINIYDSIGNAKMKADVNFSLGALMHKCGNNYESLKRYDNSAKIYDSLGLEEDLAETYNSLGVMYYDWGRYEKAIDYYNLSLSIMYKLSLKSGISQILNNMGIVYHNGENWDVALKYFEESLEIEKELENDYGIATALNNIGAVFGDKKDYEKALEYYEKSLVIYEEQKDKSGISTTFYNIGDLYSNTNEPELAIIMLERSLQMEEEIGDQLGIALALASLSGLYIKTNNLVTSSKYNDRSYKIATKINNPEALIMIYENYYKIYEIKNRDKLALDYFKKHTQLKDSIFTESLYKQLADVKARYELEQKEQQIELLNSKNQVSQLDLEKKQNVVRRQRIIMIVAISGFAVILVFLLMLFRQIRKKRAVYKILDEQNKEILQGREQLVKAKEKAEESDKLKSVFLANMSHELRTPLNGILGFTDILRTEIMDEEFRNIADFIHTSGNRLHDTLNSIIDLSIIESNRMEIVFSEIPLEEFMTEKVTLFKAGASKKNLDLSLECSGKQILIYTDRRILTNLISNLLDNAIKYTNKGSVKVIVLIVRKDAREYLKFQVADTGIGIEDDTAKYIFEKFRQGSEGHGRKFEGTGLGLTICKKYVEILDGEISLESKLHKGSVVTVLIPVKTKPMPKLDQNVFNDIPQHDEPKKHFSGQTPDVLIVENDEINTAHLVYILQGFCNVETARNGTEALDMVNLRQYDVILMDINLGAGINGMDTAKAIKKIKGFEHIPIVAVTANAMKGHREEFLANGCTHYISKPFTNDELKQMLIQIVEKSI